MVLSGYAGVSGQILAWASASTAYAKCQLRKIVKIILYEKLIL